MFQHGFSNEDVGDVGSVHFITNPGITVSHRVEHSRGVCVYVSVYFVCDNVSMRACMPT